MSPNNPTHRTAPVIVSSFFVSRASRKKNQMAATMKHAEQTPASPNEATMKNRPVQMPSRLLMVSSNPLIRKKSANGSRYTFLIAGRTSFAHQINGNPYQGSLRGSAPAQRGICTGASLTEDQHVVSTSNAVAKSRGDQQAVKLNRNDVAPPLEAAERTGQLPGPHGRISNSGKPHGGPAAPVNCNGARRKYYVKTASVLYLTVTNTIPVRVALRKQAPRELSGAFLLRCHRFRFHYAAKSCNAPAFALECQELATNREKWP